MENKAPPYDGLAYLKTIPEPQIIEIKREGLPSLWKVSYEKRLDWFIGSEDALYETKSEALGIAACNFDPRK
jgi:hypothetical protein